MDSSPDPVASVHQEYASTHGVRVHECPHRGLVLNRDIHAGVNIVGRAPRQFRESADPGGGRALADEAADKAKARRVRKLQARSKDVRTRARHAEGRSGPQAENQDGEQKCNSN
jgi:hypothetical protein